MRSETESKTKVGLYKRILIASRRVGQGATPRLSLSSPSTAHAESIKQEPAVSRTGLSGALLELCPRSFHRRSFTSGLSSTYSHSLLLRPTVGRMFRRVLSVGDARLASRYLDTYSCRAIRVQGAISGTPTTRDIKSKTEKPRANKETKSTHLAGFSHASPFSYASLSAPSPPHSPPQNKNHTHPTNPPAAKTPWARHHPAA